MAYTPAPAAGGYPVIGPLRPVVPLYVIGDSHALAFSRLTFDEDVTGATFGTRAKYIPSGFTGHAFWSEGGGLNPDLVAALEYEGLLREGRAVHFSTADQTDLAIALATEQPQVPPILIITCGDIDVRAAILPLVKGERDFIPADATPYPHTDRPLLPFDLVRRAVADRADPLVRGALRLQAVGFTRTYLHCVVPPTTDDARFRQLHGYDCPAATRYKAARAFNDYLAAECGRVGLPFLDVWPETTTADGYLRPEYELDGVHLPREAVRITLHKVLEHALGRTYLAANYPRYELYYRRCLGRPSPTPPEPRPAPEPVAAAPVVEAMPREVPAAPPPHVPARSAASRSARRAARLILPHAVRHALRVAHRRLRGARVPAEPVKEAVVTAVPEPPPPARPAAPALVEVANRPPEVCTFTDLPEVAAAAEPWVRAAVDRFRATGLAVLDVGRERASQWREMLDFSLDMSNTRVRWDWTGEAKKSYTTALRTAVPTPAFCRDLHAALTGPGMEEFFQGCLGCPATVLNCRPVRSLVHDKPGFGPQSWHGDGCPAGVIRGVLYLTDVDEDGGPFQYRGAGGEARAVTGPAGSLLVFDANRLIHRGCPPRARERFAIDLVFQARWPGEPLRVLSASVNSWPADPFVYSTERMIVYPPDAHPRRVHRTW